MVLTAISSLVLGSCLDYFIIILLSCSLLILTSKTSLTWTTGAHTSIAAMQCSFAAVLWHLGAGKAEEHPALPVALHKAAMCSYLACSCLFKQSHGSCLVVLMLKQSDSSCKSFLMSKQDDSPSFTSTVFQLFCYLEMTCRPGDI